MNTAFLKNIVLITALPFCLLSCHTAKKIACPPDVACTMMFTTISVKAMDNNTSPILLDETYTLNVATGEVIHTETSPQSGTYIVLDDSYRKKIQNTTVRFQFVGMRNGQKVIDEPYRISADCCHVSKVSGRDEIILK